jgi:F-type H+-transporting ATPase subunit a
MIPTLAAEPIAYIGAFPITNSMVNTTIVSVLLLGSVAILRRKMVLIPRGFQNAVESIVELMITYIEPVAGSAARARRFLPIVGTLFLFILISNWMGILPGVGSIGLWQTHGGEQVLVPLFRPATSDLNTTLALALFAIVGTHIFGTLTIGIWKHLNRFLQIMPIINGFRKGGINIIVGFIEFGVGIIETIGEIAKVVSLSLRLYGNIFAGEVLLTVMASIFAFGLPLPFIFMELIVGIVQALVFAMLTLAFLSIMTEEPHHS